MTAEIPPIRVDIFAAFFTRREDVSDMHVLAGVAAATGLDGDAAYAMLESGGRAEQVRAKEQFCTSRGVGILRQLKAALAA